MLAGHTGPVLSMALSGDGRYILSGGHDGLVKLWEAATGQEKATLPGTRGPRCPAWRSAAMANGFSRAVMIKQCRREWEAATGQVKHSLTGHTGPVLSVAVCAAGERLVSGSGDLSAKVWDAATGKELRNAVGTHGAGV